MKRLIRSVPPQRRWRSWLRVFGTSLFTALIPVQAGDRVWVDAQLGVRSDGTHVVISGSWAPDDGRAFLFQGAPDPVGPWSTLTNATRPLTLLMNEVSHGFFRAAVALPEGSADAPEILRRVRDYSFAILPQLNPATVFDLQVLPVGELWESLQVQLVQVRLRTQDGASFNEFAVLIHAGAITPIGISTGGYGLMSGLVQAGTFYFSYSWGSGIHRSQIGQLRRDSSGKLRFWDSGGFPNLDLFLSRRADGTIAVETGRYDGFSHWSRAGNFGRLDATDPAVTKVLSTGGTVLAELLPNNP